MDDDILDFPQLLPGMENDPTLGAELLGTPVPQYTGKIVEKNADRVQQILQARAMGFGIRQITSAFRVSAHTVAELERRHALKLATLKERLARKFGVFVELGIDRAITEVDRMDIDRLLVSLGIAADKLQVLTGEPSIIVGQPEDRSRFSVDTLRARLAARAPIDVTATGLPPQEAGQTRDGPALGAGAGDRAPDSASEGGK